MIVAVVLAAGESSRMGRPKALLPIEGTRFVERIVHTLASTRVSRTLLVLGHNAEALREQLSRLPVTFVVNRDYRLGQLSSLQAAIRELESSDEAGGIDGILVHLVDHPYITVRLVDLMIEKFYRSGKLIVIPRFRGKRGHPVIFARALFQELLDAPLEVGAKAVLRAHAHDTLEIDTEDEGVTIDVDTPEDYRRYVEKH